MGELSAEAVVSNCAALAHSFGARMMVEGSLRGAACVDCIARALAENAAALAEARGLAETNRLGWLGAATRVHELEAVVAWAREARRECERVIGYDDNEREKHGPHDPECGCAYCALRALLARAPEGVKE